MSSHSNAFTECRIIFICGINIVFYYYDVRSEVPRRTQEHITSFHQLRNWFYYFITIIRPLKAMFYLFILLYLILLSYFCSLFSVSKGLLHSLGPQLNCFIFFIIVIWYFVLYYVCLSDISLKSCNTNVGSFHGQGATDPKIYIIRYTI